MPQPERRGVAPRATPRDGDAHAAVAIHAQQVSPSALVSDEIELRRFRGFNRFNGFKRCNGFNGFNGFKGRKRFCVIPEWKTQLHGDRIPDRW